MDLRRIQKMQHLRHTRLVVAFTFASAGSNWTAEELQEIMWHLAVPKLNRAVTRRHTRKLLTNAGRLANHVKEHFGIEPFEQRPRVVLLIALIGGIRPGRKLVHMGGRDGPNQGTKI